MSFVGEILFIAHRIPWPPDRGDKIRSHHILRRLAQIAPVHVAAFADDERDMGFADELARVAASHRLVLRDMSRAVSGLRGLVQGQPLSVALFRHKGLSDYIAQIMATRPISTVFVYSGQMAQYVPDLPPHVRFVMDFVDVDSEKFAAYGREQSGPMAWVNRREGRKLSSFERRVASRADLSLFVSEAEAAMFRTAAGLGADRVRALDNGVDLNFYDPALPPAPEALALKGGGPLLVFTGQMDYRPNVEAVESFVQEALPAIRAAHHDARFAIVGRSPTPAVEALATHPGVTVTGPVDDVRGWISAADVVVAPLRIARGIQNKVLEAMAMARPVVASAAAAEGIDATAGKHLLVAADPWGEAEMVKALLADPDRAARIGLAARARVEERYGWPAVLSALPAMVAGPARDARAA